MFAEGCATVPSKHQTTTGMLSMIVMVPSIYCRPLVPLWRSICCSACCLCQGGNPAVVMAGTVKYLNTSDASRAAFASLQPVAFLSFHASCCCRLFRPRCSSNCYSVSIYRKLLELLLLQLVTAPAISATGVLPVLDILPTANADNTPVI